MKQTVTTVTREFDTEGRCIKEVTETIFIEDEKTPESKPFFTPNPAPYTPPPPYRYYPQPTWSDSTSGNPGWTHLGWTKDKPEDEDPPGLAAVK